jgi:hypothetical protein
VYVANGNTSLVHEDQPKQGLNVGAVEVGTAVVGTRVWAQANELLIVDLASLQIMVTLTQAFGWEVQSTAQMKAFAQSRTIPTHE